MLTVSLAVQLILLSMIDDRPDESKQLLELIRSKSTNPKTLVFLYEGQMRWIGDPKLVQSPASFDDEYQGTFLYRDVSTALYDLYHRNRSFAGGVIRSKAAVFNGRWEASRDVLDRSRIGPDSVRVSRGNVNSFHPDEGPNDLFPIWSLAELLITPHRKTTSDGWDQIDGRNYLRLRVVLTSTDDPEWDRRLFWIDLERGAQVVKVEFYKNSKLANRIDDIHFFEVKRGDGPAYWLPVSARRQVFGLGDKFYPAPLLERTVTVVGGSVRLDVDLPDSYFSVTNNSTLPAPDRPDGGLRKSFELQPIEPRTPDPTDPASVRARIDVNLAEAERQSKLLTASSAARDASRWGGLAQIGFVAVGLVLLAGAIVWQRRLR